MLLPTYSDVVVVQLNATDADTAEFTRLKYSIDTGNTGNRFQLNEDSGILTLREGAVDVGDMLDQYELQVSVSDGKFAGRASVHIEVKVLESSGLQFSRAEFDAEVLENSTVVERVALLPVVGRALNEHVSFVLLNADSHFSIHPTSGVVRTTGVPFDREQRERYILVAEARDARTPARVAHTLLRVRVVDVNDNSPVFVQQPYFTMVSIDAAVGSIVKKVNISMCIISGTVFSGLALKVLFVFYRATACNATHGIAVKMLSVCRPSVCLSVCPDACIVINLNDALQIF